MLSVRGLLLSKSDDMNSWIKMTRLAVKRNKILIAKKTLSLIRKDIEKPPPIQLLTELEIEHKEEAIKEQLIERLTQLIE